MIENPNSFAELKEVFRCRFNVSNFGDKDIIANDMHNHIPICCDEDLIGLNSLMLRLPRVELKESTQLEPVPKSDKEIHYDQFSITDGSSSSGTKCIGNILDKRRVPCKNCFCGTKGKFMPQDGAKGEECDVCINNKSVPMGKSWSLFFLLLETKISQRVLKPLKSVKYGKVEDFLSSCGGLIRKRDNRRNFLKKHLINNKAGDLGKIQVI